ncbi:hypothetical protein IC575_013041 [Cucumis melo]
MQVDKQPHISYFPAFRTAGGRVTSPTVYSAGGIWRCRSISVPSPSKGERSNLFENFSVKERTRQGN